MNIKQIADIDTELDPINLVLRNRGIEDFEEFFKHDWQLVQSPYALDNIEEAVRLILYHCRNSKKVAVLVDCDCDGMTSSAVIINYLRTAKLLNKFGDDNQTEIVYLLHKDKTHGLDDTDIMKQLRDIIKPDLLIIPDASGTVEQYLALTSLGIDIVVADHHETEIYPNLEKVIVVNNQQSPRYKNKELSGVGVIWQICQILDNELDIELADNWLDLVAVGLTADVMSLQSAETRFLIHEGLKPENINSLFLKQCAKDLAYSLGGDYNPTNVGFYIGPLFNAVLRIGNQQEKEILFASLLDDDATSLIPSGKRGHSGEMVTLVEEALRQATNAKSRQKRQQDKLTKLINDVITEERLFDNKVLIVAIDDFEDEHRALSGLVANKLQDEFQRPSIILFYNKEDDSYSGSCRVPDNIAAFENFRDQCLESGLTVYSAGHQAAFGIKVLKRNLLKLQEYFNDRYSNIDMTPTYKCDFILSADDPYLADIITNLAQYKDIWGQGLPEPIIAVTNVKVGHGKFSLLSADKNPTLKFALPHGVAGIKFRSSREEFDSLMLPYNANEDIQFYNTTLIGKTAINVYRDTVTPQILVEDYEIGNIEYDF